MSRFTETIRKLNGFVLGHKRATGAVAVLLLIVGTSLALRQGDSRIKTDEGGVGLGTPGGDTSPLEPGVGSTDTPGSTGARGSRGRGGSSSARPGVGVAAPTSGTIPPGVDYAKQEIKVVYYWKDDSGSVFRSSETPGDALDDSKAFDALVKFVNKHAKGSAQLMGDEIGLGNWIIKPTLVTMNNAGEINSGTTKITKEIKPFATITARGSLSTETCPHFAAAGIHNFATLHPYVNNIQTAYNGYCIPNAISWDQQVSATVNYMRWHATTKFTSADRPDPQHACVTPCDRVYGFLYSEYPGLKDQVPGVVSKLRAAGLKIPNDAVISLPAGLSSAAGAPAAGARDKFRDAGVNTVIMPDAASPLAFTHSAGNWRPDYYVWPCSGQDTTGFTRLLPAVQWDNASGLSCYDDTFDADLPVSNEDRAAQWYKAYKEIAPNSEAPSSTHLVYAALQPLVEGVSRLGNRDFTVENFRAALREFDPYRYNGNTGKTPAGDNILLLMGNSPDGSIWGDLARVAWSPAAENPFTYLDPHRYKSNQSFP